ncbi:MAG: hypothetical protein HONDAALG_02443 [Gammaproteobacteria bacterium]|nr:hypothetical protein [Gammaproteobacteria bacterium]
MFADGIAQPLAADPRAMALYRKTGARAEGRAAQPRNYQLRTLPVSMCMKSDFG